MVHTFHIDDSNNRAKALMDYLRTLDFVKEDNSDWADDLPKEVISEILEAMDEVENGRTISHTEMIAKHRKQFPHLKF